MRGRSEGKIKLRVSEAKYVVARVRDPSSLNFYLTFPFFALINDGRELTIVAEEGLFEGLEDLKGFLGSESLEAIEVEKDFRVITFETILPFDTVGFIARISQALAENSVSVLVLSSYSTDHIMVKEGDLEKALDVLRKLGYKLEDQTC